MTPGRVLVVGGGITGSTVAALLAVDHGIDVTVREAGPELGGKIRTSPFAGLAAVDEGADAFLTRQPQAVDLARRFGLADEITSPTGASATVWHDGLHPIPQGVMLGVPASVLPFVRTGLLSWRGKARAALEPFLPATSTADDAIGLLVRRRFGDEVHERLVDALVGSIYAADTDRFSLAAVPQLADLASRERSLLLGARKLRRRVAPSTGPIFAAPTDGVGALVDAVVEAARRAGVTIVTSSPVTTVEADGPRWRVDGEPYDAVVLASPARVTALIVAGAAPEAARLMAQLEHADVLIVTVLVPDQQWPAAARGWSGYLVPKPDQHLVTAASFGSQKWAHWRPPGGGQVVRVSLGRDGLPVDHLDDAAAVGAAVTELGRHIGADLAPTEVRVSRWPGAFPQHRPHHAAWVAAVEAALPPGLHVGGASYHGIGIPACIRQAHDIVESLTRREPAAR